MLLLLGATTFELHSSAFKDQFSLISLYTLLQCYLETCNIVTQIRNVYEIRQKCKLMSRFSIVMCKILSGCALFVFKTEFMGFILGMFMSKENKST